MKVKILHLNLQRSVNFTALSKPSEEVHHDVYGQSTEHTTQ